jgi:steroid 5-alpha reductase family enzyme
LHADNVLTKWRVRYRGDMLRERHVIDAFKGATAPVVLALMGAYDAWERPTAWLYLALHGVYGVLWVIKSRVFGDASWERPLTPRRGLKLVAGLAAYWAAPWLLMSSGREAPAAALGAWVALGVFGVFQHFAADMQKHTTLRLRPGVLLTEGLWARTRNPNYLGELCIYAAFAGLSQHPLPWALFGAIILAEWVPNMRRKDASLARYPAFAEYKARTGLLLPRFFVKELK